MGNVLVTVLNQKSGLIHQHQDHQNLVRVKNQRVKRARNQRVQSQRRARNQRVQSQRRANPNLVNGNLVNGSPVNGNLVNGSLVKVENQKPLNHQREREERIHILVPVHDPVHILDHLTLDQEAERDAPWKKLMPWNLSKSQLLTDHEDQAQDLVLDLILEKERNIRRRANDLENIQRL